MTKKGNSKRIEQLIDLGRERGYLTYDEVNDMLPRHMLTSEELDDVMIMFGEMDIRVIDGAKKAKLAVQKQLQDKTNRLFVRAAGQWELSERIQLAGEVFPAFFNFV